MDRRRQERYELTVPIRVECDEGASPSFGAFSKDISSSGVFIDSGKTSIRDKQKVHLEFTLTIDKLKELFGGSSMVALKIDGVVVRTPENGIVIEFENRYSILPIEKTDGMDRVPPIEAKGWQEDEDER